MTKFTEGERVWCYDLDGSMVCGTIHRNTDHPDVSDWYIKYDDGKECAVLDIEQVHKLNNYSMTNPKTITASLDKIVEAVVQDLGEASEGNGYRLTTYKNKWWIEHRHVGSGEPLSQFLRTALEGLGKPDQRDDLLERASWLVGNPGTNISGSTDLACDSWQRDYEHFIKSKPTPTEKGGSDEA